MPTVRRLLIANRGEIARRIERTARNLGIRTVAVYTNAERDEPFVAECTEAVRLDGSGPAPYLDIKTLIDVARRTGADSVHPGYGFLAENADFATAVADAGLTWVGPPADCIARMGDKLKSKRVAREAGVPTLEPVDADRASFPALVKAAAGGGGKGMRIVRSSEELDSAIAAAQREAERAFGDGTVFIEPFLEKSRHVEVQVLGDAHGRHIHLFERECSIQRRHQKVVEEAPSVAVDAELRERLGDAALSLARAIGYRNAGTVEFLLDADGRFFFMEMNTRLQVEHPVTEEITGIDLVEQQILDASGDHLSDPLSPGPLGHAIEARLNAEDPTNDFLPATGTIVGWGSDADVRIESGVRVGSVVATTFDPLLAKVIAWGDTRVQAASRLAHALEAMTIQGVTTNRDLLVSILRSDELLVGDTTTDFLERVELSGKRRLSGAERNAALAAVVLDGEQRSRSGAGVVTTLPSGWRNSIMPAQRRLLEVDGEETTVEYSRSRSGEAMVNGRPAHLGSGVVELDGRAVAVDVNRVGDRAYVHGSWGDVEIIEQSPFPTTSIEEDSGSLHAPMPGSVVSVAVAVGDTVRKGQTLVVLEAMKMEHPIACPEDGVVVEVKAAPGDQVERGTVLVVVDSGEGTPA